MGGGGGGGGEGGNNWSIKAYDRTYSIHVSVS